MGRFIFACILFSIAGVFSQDYSDHIVDQIENMTHVEEEVSPKEPSHPLLLYVIIPVTLISLHLIGCFVLISRWYEKTARQRMTHGLLTHENSEEFEVETAPDQINPK